eukprot:gb/GECH01012221.1/.p1 GENE.gb/GECH01012221.1/~~gb/GECH01012221.1/.p1  ORF type:complete len:134 (+),score=34.93 gb/GECH01012221.1/:1-402(+)
MWASGIRRIMSSTANKSSMANNKINYASSSSSSSSSVGPIEQSIRSKLQETFSPSSLTITNNSHLHAHHTAMQNHKYASTGETHFKVNIVSAAFQGRRALERHRMVNRTLAEELDGPVHALNIRAKTPEEIAK